MITDQDKTFLEYVKQNKDIGYERMMQIIGSVMHVEVERKQQVATNDLAEAILSSMKNTKANIERDKGVGEAAHLRVLVDNIEGLCCAAIDWENEGKHE